MMMTRLHTLTPPPGLAISIAIDHSSRGPYHCCVEGGGLGCPLGQSEGLEATLMPINITPYIY